MNTLENLIHRCRQGEQISVSWDELRPFFPGRTDKSRYEAAFDWATENGLSAGADEISIDPHDASISAKLKFWDGWARK